MIAAAIDPRVSAWLHLNIGGAIQWDDPGEAIAWHDQTTVVLREELIAILELLKPRGLPPASAAILVLAATRGKIFTQGELETLRVMSLTGSAPVGGTAESGLEALEWVATLPAAIRAGIPQRANLLWTVLAKFPWADSTLAEQVLQELRCGLPKAARPGAAASRDVQLELDLFHLGRELKPRDAAAIDLALRTGLEAVPEAAEIELPVADQVGALLKTIENEPSLAPLASLARDIMAALTLPRSLPQPLAEVCGGMGDIGIRGPLHRLLLSELAHDDDTLAARIALNEALYLRPEPTAEPPPTQLVVLIDCGIRLWGLPRVFATAVALACLARTPKGATLAAYRASGESLVPTPIYRRDGLEEHLAVLEPAAHPGAALRGVASLQVEDKELALDVVLITHPAVLADEEFERSLGSDPRRTWGCYAVTVDRLGHLVMSVRNGGRWVELSRARLDLQRLIAAPEANPVMQIGRPPGPVPAILKCNPFPFSLPISGEIKFTISLPDEAGNLAITNQGSAWHWIGLRTGARRVRTQNLRGKILGIVRAPFVRWSVALSWSSATSSLMVLQVILDDGVKGRTFGFDGVDEEPCAWWVTDDTLLVTSRRHTWAFSLSQGTRLSVTPNPEPGTIEQQAGRPPFIITPNQVMAVSWDGLAVRFEKVGGRTIDSIRNKVRTIVRCEQSEDIFVLAKDGRIYIVGSEGALRDVAILGVSEGYTKFPPLIGDSLDFNPEQNAFRLRGPKGPIFVSLKGKVPTLCEYPDFGTTQGSAPHHWTIRRKFTQIARTRRGIIALRAAKGYWVSIRLHNDQQCLCFQDVPSGDSLLEGAEIVSFGEVEDYEGWELRTAVFSDSSRAWLDVRGLLHLQSDDASVPEVSIVLAESSSLPAWMSDGTMIGSSYFIGDYRGTRLDAKHFNEVLQRFSRLAS